MQFELRLDLREASEISLQSHDSGMVTDFVTGKLGIDVFSNFLALAEFAELLYKLLELMVDLLMQGASTERKGSDQQLDESSLECEIGFLFERNEDIFKQIHKGERVEEGDVHGFGEVVERVQSLGEFAGIEIGLQVLKHCLDNLARELEVLPRDVGGECSVEVSLERHSPNNFGYKLDQILHEGMITLLTSALFS
jgi:hypothetical protein